MAKEVTINWNEITGNAKIFTNEIQYKRNGKTRSFLKSSISIGSKDQDGNYHNFYLDLKFAGKKAEEPKEEGQHILQINNAFFSVEYWNDEDKKERTKPILVVTDCDIVG